MSPSKCPGHNGALHCKIAQVRNASRIAGFYLAVLITIAVLTAAARLFQHSSVLVVVSGIALFAILGSAWWGGYGPGIFATVLVTGVAPFFVSPAFSFSKINASQLILLLVISALISRVAVGRNEREAMLRGMNEQLDERVRKRTEQLERANAALREREELLLRQSDELARSNADLQQFAYLASHDLQEPLRLVSVYAELLSRQYHARLDTEADRIITVIVDGVRRMEALIRDLLSYSRVIHAEEPVIQEQLDPAEALGIAVANLEMAIQESGATIQWGPLPSVACDRVELTQIFQNLLSNALKYRGDMPPRVEIVAQPGREFCVFSVRDNGIGIHSAYHDAIFTPFKRLHGRQYPGTGIGLALCRRMVERQGGKIWVESEAGRGATFWFTIPTERRNVEVDGGRAGAYSLSR